MSAPACVKCNDTGSVTRVALAGLIEACGECRVHTLAWQPYYDDLRQRWLSARSKKKGLLTAEEEAQLKFLKEKYELGT